MKRIFLFTLSVLFSIIVFSQTDLNFSSSKDSVDFYLSEISNWENSDRVRFEQNENLQKYVEKFLDTASFFNTELDSVRFLSVLKSDNQNLKIFTWLSTNQTGKATHFGFVQKFESNGNIKVFRLNDSKDESLNHFFQTYTNENWFGALYYTMKTIGQGESEYYILTGYDPKDIHSNRKVIDVLSFDASGNIIFGLPVFKQGKSFAYRVVFEFTERASMMLRFDEQYDMFIFDHLSPISNEYAGNPKFYGPDFSYDALKFDKGYWMFINDVDIRNPEVPKKSKKEYKYSW